MSKSFNLNGKNILITGSTKGIGRGIAEITAEAGANVIITSRHQEDCDEVANIINKKYGVKTLGISFDVTDINSIELLVQNVIKNFSKIDVLFNNAGTAITKKVDEITEKDWDKIININLKGAFFVSQKVAKIMMKQKEGKIINISSIFGTVGEKQILPYLASKGGLNQITRGLSLELAKYNINVNSIAPGYIKTPMNKKDLEMPKIHDHIMSNTPLKRFAKIEDLYGVILLLASDYGDYITGEIIKVDGGWTAH